MNLDFLKNFIVLVVVGVCLCVGYVIKHVFPGDKINKFIPLIMAVLGVVINLWVNGWLITPEILLGGLFSGLASTGLHQLFKNFIEMKNKAYITETEDIEITENIKIENLKE